MDSTYVLLVVFAIIDILAVYLLIRINNIELEIDDLKNQINLLFDELDNEENDTM